MALGKKQIRLAKHIDEHVKKVIAEGGDDETLLLSMPDYMGTFKQLMDATSKEQMDELCERFTGFYRFGKLLESLARGIQDGSIQVP